MKTAILRKSVFLAIATIMMAGLMLGMLSACADKSPAYWNYDLANAPSEESIINCLERSAGVWNFGIEAATEENDPNGMLHKAGGYTSCVYFESFLIDQTQFEERSIVEKGVDCGGCIEVYSSVADAEKRNKYLSSFDGTIFSAGSHTVVGTIIIRVSDELTATQQKAIETSIMTELIYTEASEKQYKTEVTVESRSFAKMMAETLFLSKEQTIYELVKQGYSTQNIATIFEASDIMWEELACEKAIVLGAILETPSRVDISRWLTDSYLFAEEEAEFAVQHCGIDWKNNLLAEWTSMCIEDVENAIQNINSYQTNLRQEIFDRGFTEAELEYAVGNSEALIHVILNWTDIDNDAELEALKDSMQTRFSDEEIEFAIAIVQIFEDEINFIEATASEGTTAHQHLWSSWSIVTPPTCLKGGLQEKSCKCGARETQNINKEEHNYTATVVAPTGSEQGYTKHICSQCGDEYRDSYVSSKLAYVVNKDGRTCTITGRGTIASNKIVIPSQIDGYEVTNIGGSAFEGDTLLTSITIPESVTSIGKKVFYGCSSLESITVPFVGASKYESEDSHFGYLFGAGDYGYNGSYVPNSLKTVVILDGSSISPYAFSACLYLETITILENVTSIGDYAFDNCSSLTNITLPDTVTRIGKRAFQHCSNLTSIRIPDGVTSIDSYTFWCCRKLASVVIPKSVKSIGDHAFAECSGLKSVAIPNGVTTIKESAFSNCSSLASVTIPHSVTSIGDLAFFCCSSLTSITLPGDVSSIGARAFESCNLTSIRYEGTVTKWGSVSLGKDWMRFVPATKVICSNGTVALN